MTNLFQSADLGDIFEGESLQITEAKTKTYIEVAEWGIEAGPVKGMNFLSPVCFIRFELSIHFHKIMFSLSISTEDSGSVNSQDLAMLVDRPFVWWIAHDNFFGTPLFSGNYKGPKKVINILQ